MACGMRVEQPLIQAICNQKSLQLKMSGKEVVSSCAAGVLGRSRGMMVKSTTTAAALKAPQSQCAQVSMGAHG